MTCPRCKGNDSGFRMVAMITNTEKVMSAVVAPCSCMTAKDYGEGFMKGKFASRSLGKTGSEDSAFVNEKYRRNADVQKRRREFSVVVNDQEIVPEKSKADLKFVVDGEPPV